MKAASCFLYILLTIIYLRFDVDNERLWFGFNIITQIMFTATLCLFLTSEHRPTETERLLFYFVCTMSVGRAFYTSLCIYENKAWVLYNTDIFCFIVCVCFVILLIYLALK